MDEVSRAKRNARRRERYAKDIEHRAKRRDQAESWKSENRESYLAQQREAARVKWKTDPVAQKRAGKKWRKQNKKQAVKATREWLDKHPGYHAQWHAKNKLKNPVLYVWRNCKNRAKRLGVTFDLELEDIVVPEFCPVLGIKLEWGRGLKTGLNAPNAPSVDRIVGEKGYTKCNIRVISSRANILKRDGTLDEFKALVQYLEASF